MYDNIHVVAFEMNKDVIDCTMLQVLDYIDMSQVPEDFEFLPNNKYIVIGKKEPKELWEAITSRIHLGPRGEGFADCTKMDYLRTYDDVIFKFTYEFLLTDSQTQWIRSEKEFNDMKKNIDILKLSVKNPKFFTGISRKTGKPWYRYECETLVPDLVNFITDEGYIKRYPVLKSHKIVRTTEDIKSSIEYLLNLKPIKGQSVVRLGLDYEANGFPFDKEDFMVMGVAIADLNRNAIYFDIEWMQHVGNNYDHFLELYKQVLDKYHEEIYTYNVNFEQRVTYLLTGKLYFFSDSATLNKLDCLVYKNFSLKYTAMKNLHTKSWDDQFDYLGEMIDVMMNGKYEKGRAGVTIEIEAPTEKSEYKDSRIWKLIMSNPEYKAEEKEFERLIEAYWGNQFACIPSNILGKYCCWDSFNTVLLRIIAQTRYSDKAWVMYNNNLRLGSLLQLHGAVIDVPYREKLSILSSGMIAYSQCTTVRLWLYHEMKYLGIEFKDIPEINNIWKSWNKLFNIKTDRYGITSLVMDTKTFISSFIADEDEASDEFGFKLNFKDSIGEELYEEITDITSSMVGSVTPSIRRKKSYFDNITKFLSQRWDIVLGEYSTDMTINGVHYHFDRPIDQVENFFIYFYQFRYLTHLCNQIDPNNPEESYVDINDNLVKTHDIGELCCSIKNVDSPMEVPYLRLSMYEEFKNNFVYIQGKGSMEKDDLRKVITDSDITEDYYQEVVKKDTNLGMIDSCYKLSESIIKQYILQMKGEFTDKSLRSYSEPEILFYAKRNYKRYLEDKNPVRFVRSCIVDHVFDLMGKGDDVQEEVTNEGEDFDLSAENGQIRQVSSSVGTKYHHPSEIVKWRTVVSAMTNLRQEYYLEHFNKYCFIKLATDECADEFYKIFNETDVCDGSIAAYNKAQLCFTASKKYEKSLGTYLEGQFSTYTKVVNANDDNLISTQRYHKEYEMKSNPSLIYKMYSPMNVCEKQSKRWSGPMHTVPSRSEVKRCCTTPDGYLMSYFDISGAEIRAISYMSNDQYMLDCYSKKLDPYLTLAAQLDPEHDRAYHKSIRWKYKMILLGSIYGMGIQMLANMTGMSLEECTTKHTEMFNRMTGIAKFIKEYGTYCVEHEGICKSILGDHLQMSRNEKDRWARLGVNQVIQGFAACSLADGFFNVNYQSYMHPDKYPKVRVWNTVHDSSQNYFEIQRLFDVGSYYYETLTEYLWDKYKVRYEFDTEVGVNYFDMCHYNSVSPTKLELTGSYLSVKGVLDKVKNSGLLNIEIESLTRKDVEYECKVENNWYTDDFVPNMEWHIYGKFANRHTTYLASSAYERDHSEYKVVLNKL